jgi:hypothetical protein
MKIKSVSMDVVVVLPSDCAKCTMTGAHTNLVNHIPLSTASRFECPCSVADEIEEAPSASKIAIIPCIARLCDCLDMEKPCSFLITVSAGLLFYLELSQSTV